MNDEIPLSIGGGIGQSRTLMLLLRKAHLGEVSVTVWPKVLKEMCDAEEHSRAELRPLSVVGCQLSVRARSNPRPIWKAHTRRTGPG